MILGALHSLVDQPKLIGPAKTWKNPFNGLDAPQTGTYLRHFFIVGTVQMYKTRSSKFAEESACFNLLQYNLLDQLNSIHSGQCNGFGVAVWTG